MSKIGLGIITCNREDFLRKCYKSVPVDKLQAFVIVNDGKKLKGKYKKADVIQHKQNKGVGVSKNDALKFLLEKDCEHLFLIEDDIFITNNDVFRAYIKAADETGIKHFMFGYHGPANKTGSKGQPTPRLFIEYKNNIKIALNTHCVGAFCYFHKTVLDKIGLFDEAYNNVWEHVDHSYCAVKAGLIPGYWWWPDIANSCDYLDEQACSEEFDKGVIRKQSDWELNLTDGARHFFAKHQYMPNTVPDLSPDDIYNNLKQIKKEYKATNA